MNYRKQIKKIVSGRDNNAVMVGVAVAGGLAVGAALAVLFAPKKGPELRDAISERGRQFGGTLSELMDALKAKFAGGESVESECNDHEGHSVHAQAPVKKPKSDIKELIHEAHNQGHSPEQHS